MEIRTRLKRGHVLRQGIIALVCVVLGLWGVYDYVWTIPHQQEAHDRYQVCQAVVNLLETDPSAESYEEKRETARHRVQAALDTLAERSVVEPDEAEPPPATEREALQRQVEQAKQAIEKMNTQGNLEWFKTLLLFAQAIERPRPPAMPQAKLSGVHAAAWEIASEGVNYFAEVTPPDAYDRIMKGLVFIPCFPIGLYMLVVLWRQHRRQYRLEDDGNLRLPGGELWKRDEIEDINMSRWMSKSIARVQHSDGRETKLDDYIYQDMHLIVGSLAHRLHPDQWHEDARQVKDESNQADVPGLSEGETPPGEGEPAAVADGDGGMEDDRERA